MSRYYYAGPDKKPVGPFTTEEVSKLVEEGKINDNTYLIGEGQTTWVRYADWKAAQGSAEAAEAIARKAQQVKTAISKFDFGSSIFGLLLVIVEIFVLPWRLISRAAVTLATWGSSRILPTSQSELPVATFITVVLRPAVHMFLTVIGGLVIVGYSLYLIVGGISDSAAHHRPAHHQPASMFGDSTSDSASAEHGSVLGGIRTLIGGLLAVYFANLLIGAIFDSLSIAVLMANSLRNIERK